MITDYHIQQLLRKMDEIVEVNSAIISRLEDIAFILDARQPKSIIQGDNMEPQSVKIDNGMAEPVDCGCVPAKPVEAEKASETTTDEKSVVEASQKSKRFNKTQAFKDYQAAGGTLSWNKWKAAGMPLKPEDAQVQD